MNKYYMYYRYPCASILMLVLLPISVSEAKRWMHEESFCYDDLARLTASGGEANTCHDEFVYDSLGNIRRKGGMVYHYQDKPNQLSKLEKEDGSTRHYSYDLMGNQLRGDKENAQPSQSNQWTAFGKPWIMTRRIEANQYNSTEISYSPEHKRIHRRDYETRDGVEAVTNTQYVDNLYEQITKDETTVTHKHRISDVAVYNIYSDQSSRLSYQHKDHIDSLISETSNINQYETIKQKHLTLYSFDAWGARRDAEHWQGVVSHEGLDSVDENRGFTGHEMLDGVALIHMNGRVYDSELGRFLSPDTLIQAPSNTQSFNRYVYVWNNPLSNTDPSGNAVVSGSIAISIWAYRAYKAYRALNAAQKTLVVAAAASSAALSTQHVNQAGRTNDEGLDVFIGSPRPIFDTSVYEKRKEHDISDVGDIVISSNLERYSRHSWELFYVNTKFRFGSLDIPTGDGLFMQDQYGPTGTFYKAEIFYKRLEDLQPYDNVIGKVVIVDGTTFNESVIREGISEVSPETVQLTDYDKFIWTSVVLFAKPIVDNYIEPHKGDPERVIWLDTKVQEHAMWAQWAFDQAKVISGE